MKVSSASVSPVHVCHLYVEGSGAGDHFKQVVPHHQLTAEHRAERQECSDVPRWISSTYSPADRERHSPLFALLHFVNLLQRDDFQRLPLLQGRREEKIRDASQHLEHA